MQVDLTPVLDTSISLAALALGTVGTFALARLGQKLGIQKDSAAMANWNAGINSSISLGIVQAEDIIRRKGWDHVDVRNDAVATGLDAMLTKFPGAVKAVGLDPDSNSVAVHAKIQDALERAFPAAVSEIAASPATPPATLTMATAPEQDPVPAKAVDLVAGGISAVETPDISPLLTNLIASHETTNALLGKLVDQGAVVVDPPKAELDAAASVLVPPAPIVPVPAVPIAGAVAA